MDFLIMFFGANLVIAIIFLLWLKSKRGKKWLADL